MKIYTILQANELDNLLIKITYYNIHQLHWNGDPDLLYRPPKSRYDTAGQIVLFIDFNSSTLTHGHTKLNYLHQGQYVTLAQMEEQLGLRDEGIYKESRQ